MTEFRQYRTFDATLETGPYNFSYVNNAKFVDHFPYQDGMLISYWDTSMEDNNTSEHPGEGLILPIDAHPAPLIRGDGNPWRARVQAYDSTFGLEPTDPISLGFANFATNAQYPVTHHPSLPAVPVFRDRLDYWSPATPLASVMVPKTGTAIEVIKHQRARTRSRRCSCAPTSAGVGHGAALPGRPVPCLAVNRCGTLSFRRERE